MRTKHLLPIILVAALIVDACVLISIRRQQRVPPVQAPPQQQSPPEVKPEPQLQDALSAISADNLKKHDYYLSSPELEGRMSGTKGCVLAQNYIQKQLEAYKLPIKLQEFHIVRTKQDNQAGNDTTYNICACMNGNDAMLRKQIVVIGAHYDHIGYGNGLSRSKKAAINPGADDNGSGTSTVLELARVFSMLKGQNKRTILFQFYSGEELGLKGSAYYCEHPLFPLDAPSLGSHVFMANFDMVGRLNEKCYISNKVFTDVPSIANLIKNLEVKYPFAEAITNRGGGGSDHASFRKKSIPVAFFFTGLHADYHTPGDTPDKINFEGMQQIAKYGFEFIWSIVQADQPPEAKWVVAEKLTDEGDHDVFPFPDWDKQ
jgi:hypothetical protein